MSEIELPREWIEETDAVLGRRYSLEYDFSKDVYHLVRRAYAAGSQSRQGEVDMWMADAHDATHAAEKYKTTLAAIEAALPPVRRMRMAAAVDIVNEVMPGLGDQLDEYNRLLREYRATSTAISDRGEDTE